MRNRLLLGFITFAFIATALLVIPVGFTLEYHESASALNALRHDTTALKVVLTNALSHKDLAQATKLSRTYARSSGRQILVIDSSGVLIASKFEQRIDSALMEIAADVQKSELSGVTPRSVNEGPQYYVAAPLVYHVGTGSPSDRVVLVVTYPVGTVSQTVRSDWRNLIIYGILMLVLACLFGLLISTSLVKPLRRIAGAVEEIGNGELNVRAPVDKGPDELRRLAGTINGTASRLITLLEVQRSFVEDASHQLRTPLTALQLHLENLQHRGNELSGHDFDAVHSEVARLNRLVDSLLALARNESTSPILVPVDLNVTVVERMDLWRPLADEHGITLIYDVKQRIDVVAVDGVLEQILDNLLSNAFDATPVGGTISISARSLNEFVELHVVDDGSGLSPVDRDQALRRFWRGRNSTSEGSGLGLAIVDQLVRLSGGSIELRESTTHGIDATVRLRKV